MAYLAERVEWSRRRLPLHGSEHQAATRVQGQTVELRTIEATLEVSHDLCQPVLDTDFSMWKRWERSLPPRLHLTEDNLLIHGANAEFGDSMASWAFSMMHCLKSCSILALHAVSLLSLALMTHITNKFQQALTTHSLK